MLLGKGNHLTLMHVKAHYRVPNRIVTKLQKYLLGGLCFELKIGVTVNGPKDRCFKKVSLCTQE